MALRIVDGMMNVPPEFFRQLFQQTITPMVIVEQDDQTRITTANDAFCALTGYDLEEIVSKPFDLLRGPDTNLDEEAIMATCFRDGHAYTGINLNYRKDGTSYWVERSVMPIRDPWGNVTAFVSVEEDITDRVENEKNLRMLAEAVNAAGDPVMITDQDHNVVFVNFAFEVLTGYRASDVLGRGPMFLNSSRRGKDHTYDDAREALERGEHARITTNLLTSTGPLLHVSLSVVPVTSEDGDIQRYVAVIADVSELMEEKELLARAAGVDRLTGLSNRHHGETTKDELHDEWTNHGRTYCVILADIDHFKKVNDTYGHPAGDRILTRVAAALASTARKHDIVTRWGGEEFVLFLPDATLREAEGLAERLRTTIASIHDDEVGSVTMSFGVAEVGPSHTSAGDVIHQADEALYAAKRAGRNRVTVA